MCACVLVCAYAFVCICLVFVCCACASVYCMCRCKNGLCCVAQWRTEATWQGEDAGMDRDIAGIALAGDGNAVPQLALLDTDHNGSINLDEFTEGMRKVVCANYCCRFVSHMR